MAQKRNQNHTGQRPDFLGEMLEQIETHEMLHKDDRWLVAVSGGCDSMALLYGLVQLKLELPELTYLHVAHLNHCLRGDESDTDAEFVKGQAQTLGLDVTIKRADVKAQAQRWAESIETAARKVRYEFLEAAARKEGCGKIALAHNADDQVETILHRILRGTGIKGLAGIPAIRQTTLHGNDPLWLVRPLLQIRRGDIEAYLEDHRIPTRRDSSNLSKEFTRNRIRHDLIPLLQSQYNQNVVETIHQLGHMAQWLSEMLLEEVCEALEDMTLDSQGDGLTLDIVKLKQMPKMQQAQIVHQALLELKIPLRRIGFKQITAVLKLLNPSQPCRKSDTVIQLPYRLTVKRTGDKLIFAK